MGCFGGGDGNEVWDEISEEIIFFFGYFDSWSGDDCLPLSGMDDDDDGTVPLHEMLDDQLRIFYYKGYLAAIDQAIKDGTNVKGYFAWSLLDNFEWHLGYTKRFGLIHLDFKNGLVRRLKSSAYWFLRFLKGREEKYGKEE